MLIPVGTFVHLQIQTLKVEAKGSCAFVQKKEEEGED